MRDLSKTAINCSIKGVNGQNYLVGGEFLMFPEIAKMIGELLDRRTFLLLHLYPQCISMFHMK